MPEAAETAHRPIIARIVPKSLIARSARQMWGPMLPIATRLSPRLLARFSGLIDNDEFAKAISETPDEQLAAGMNTKLRGVILDEIVGRMKDEFVADRAGDLDAVIEFVIDGRADGGVDIYQVRIKDSQCETGKGKVFTDTPTSVIEVGPVDFLKMTTGNVGSIDLYISGKLKWDGGMMMLTRLVRIFNIPDAPEAKPVAA